MWLVVLRSLLVYGGTTAVLLALARRWVAPVRLRAGLFLALAPLLFTGRAILSGGVYAPLDVTYQAQPLLSLRSEMEIGKTRNGLLVDVVSQMIPWRHAVREALAEGRPPLWNPHVLAGEPLLGVMQPAVLHPGTWVGMLLPLPQAWTFDMSLRIFLALLCGYVFFRGTRSSELASLLGASAWAFSDFLIFFTGYPVTPSVAPFPLLLLGLTRLVQEGSLRAVGITTAALVLSVVAGHPETLLFIVAGGGIYFLFELAAAGPGGRRRPVVLALCSGALALGLTAVALLPFLEALPQTAQHAFRKLHYAGTDRSAPLIEGLRRLVTSAVPYAFGALGKSEVVGRLILPAGYAGTILIPLACAGAAARWPRRRAFFAMGLFGLALHLRLPGVTDLLVALPLFDIAICDYFIFLWVFALCGLAVAGADRLRQGYGLRRFAAGAIAASMLVIGIVAVRSDGLRDLAMPPAHLRARVLMQIVPLLLGLGLIAACARRRRFGALPVAALLAVLLAQRRLEEKDVYPTFPARAFYPPLPALAVAPPEGPSRFVSLGATFAPNIAAMYGLEDVRGYDPMLFGPLAETIPIWSAQLPVFFNRVDDPRSPVLAFLNVRRVLAPPGYPVPGGWRLLADDRGGRLFENPKALPRLFAPRNVGWTDDPRLQLWVFQRISDFAADGVVGVARTGPPGWRPNGEARVRIGAHGPDRLSATIDALGEAVIGTSIPAWKGWKLSLDGRPAPLLPYNRAFLAFEVPAGRHEAVLRYLPGSFVAGAAISAATLALAAALALRRKPGAAPARR